MRGKTPATRTPRRRAQESEAAKRQLRLAFLFEARFQCVVALEAAEDQKRALARGNVDRVWYATHALLAAANNLSVLLWPPRAASRRRGEYLRARLGVRSDSPLRLEAMRAVMDHFDERLEAWSRSAARPDVVDYGITLAGSAGSTDETKYLRHLDATALRFTFGGHQLELRPLIAAIAKLQARVRSEIAPELGTPLIHYLCRNPEHQRLGSGDQPAPGSQIVLHAGGWSFCPAGAVDGHDWEGISGIPVGELRARLLSAGRHGRAD